MHGVEDLCKQLRSLGESLEEPEATAVALQGLPRAYHRVTRIPNVCATADVTLGKLKYALLQEQQRQKRDSPIDEAAYMAAISLAILPKALGTVDPIQTALEDLHHDGTNEAIHGETISEGRLPAL